MKSLSTQPRQLVTTGFCYLAIVLVICGSQTIKAQTCDNIPQGGSESLTAWITNRDMGAPLNGQGIVPVNTYIRIDAIATAFGQCLTMGWNCQVSPCECVNTGNYERTVSTIPVNADMSTSGTLNGNYFIGNVYGKNPDGTTADWHVLSTEASDSSGPLYAYLAYPGTYEFHIQAVINLTPCNMQPDRTEMITIRLSVGPDDGAPNSGHPSCAGVGEPVNVTNGNTYIEQTDYRLPGIGDGLEITRSYNSKNQTAGLFGYGWSSILDESIIAYGNTLLRLNLPDGRAVYLTRPFDEH